MGTTILKTLAKKSKRTLQVSFTLVYTPAAPIAVAAKNGKVKDDTKKKKDSRLALLLNHRNVLNPVHLFGILTNLPVLRS